MQEALLITTDAVELPATIYVHLCSGEELEIRDVGEIAITDEYVVFTRGDLEAVIVDRRQVYYTCCQPGAAPSAY
jgi:hypothetical protein